MAAYYEHSCQQTQDMATQMQKASESYIERVEDQCNGLEESCRAVVEKAAETLEQRTQLGLSFLAGR